MSGHAHPLRLEVHQLNDLIGVLGRQGFTVIGPVVQEGALMYAEIQSAGDLPVGWMETQSGGHYRLERRADQAHFACTVGPSSVKRFLHPPRATLFQARRTPDGMDFHAPADPPPRYAFLGLRACELAAVAIQDTVFLKQEYQDSIYAARREAALLIAAECSIRAADTCFCTSMQTGPQVRENFDLCLTEVLDDAQHYFLLRSGSSAGEQIMRELDAASAAEAEQEVARERVNAVAAGIQKTMDTDGIQELMYRHYESSQWDEVATRCLSCTNCTMVCPTCFCTTVEDITDLNGESAERVRRWDSCFTLDFTYANGANIRSSGAARYRQWISHKLGTWYEQFDTSGCVGCGRCITWCPVGIDITEEVARLRRQTALPSGGDHER
ncbi:MAG: 4Fe-4S dicluster domain-containing protein [Leptospiraceae bacterium]|nr:4Fe-4S dicluster domain-containing protein [Leptospiraceae bacterium]